MRQQKLESMISSFHQFFSPSAWSTWSWQGLISSDKGFFFDAAA